MSRASSDIRQVSVAAASLPVDAWSLWTKVEEWIESANEFKEIFLAYALDVGAAVVFVVLLVIFLRYQLRKSRVRRYLKEK